MVRFSVEDKLGAVQKYVEGQDSQKNLARRYNVDQRMLKQWIDLYLIHGEEGLRPRPRYTKYSAEFKLDVLKYMSDHGASAYEAAAVFKIPSRSVIGKWQKAVAAGGVDALIPREERRPSVKEKPKKLTSSKKTPESLQEEVERLRMENAYLKKLNALAREKESSPRNSKHK